MKIRIVLCATVVFAFMAVNVFAGPRPNIVFIFTDDHAYQAIGAYGSNRNETPAMDRLAREGMRFTNCCVTNSLCGPSRAVIQTGKYSHINGFMTNNDRFNIDQPTFPKMLRESDYQTAIIGKWHLVCDVQGYDYSEVLIGQGPYYNPQMIRNGQRVQHRGHTTEIITDLSIDWLEKRDKNKPFMLMVQHKAPHRSWDPFPKYYAKYKDREFPYPDNFDDDYSNRGTAAKEQDMTIEKTLTRRDLKLNFPDGWNGFSDEQKTEWHEMFDSRKTEFEAVKDDQVALKRWKYQCYMKDYLSCVAAVDESIGTLTDYLEKSGLDKNTVVIYASDQGFYLGEHGWFDKRFMYQESFKTPLIVRWPETVKPGAVNNELVSNLDFAPTFLEMAGAKIPEDMQGRSLVPVLKGEKPTDWRTSIYYHYYEFPGEHKVKKHEGIFDGRYKLIHFYDDIDEWELYDIQEDPHEMHNIYGIAKYAKEIERLRDELDREKARLKVPPIKINDRSKKAAANVQPG